MAVYLVTVDGTWWELDADTPRDAALLYVELESQRDPFLRTKGGTLVLRRHVVAIADVENRPF